MKLNGAFNGEHQNGKMKKHCSTMRALQCTKSISYSLEFAHKFIKVVITVAELIAYSQNSFQGSHMAVSDFSRKFFNNLKLI